MTVTILVLLLITQIVVIVIARKQIKALRTDITQIHILTENALNMLAKAQANTEKAITLCRLCNEVNFKALAANKALVLFLEKKLHIPEQEIEQAIPDAIRPPLSNLPREI